MDTEQTHKAFSETVREAAALYDLVGELRTKLDASTTRTHFWKKKFENQKEKDLIIRAQNMALLTKVADLQDELIEVGNRKILSDQGSIDKLDEV